MGVWAFWGEKNIEVIISKWIIYTKHGKNNLVQ
jgi:hypothetical protein